MKLQVEVEYADGRKDTVTVGPVSQVAFEREHKCGIGSLAADQRIEHLYWLAWHGATRGVGSFDDWLAEVEGVEDATAAEATPFPAAASDGG